MRGLIIPDSSTRALWQLPIETTSSEAGETWQEMAVNFAYGVSLFIIFGLFNMPLSLETRCRWRYFLSEGRRASDFYRPQKSIAFGRV
jgi:hypothetical protein